MATSIPKGCGQLVNPNGSSQRCGFAYGGGEVLFCQSCQDKHKMQREWVGESLDTSVSILQEIGEILEVPGGHQHKNLPNVLRERLKAQNMRDGHGDTPAKSAVSDQWLSDVIDLLHALSGDLQHDSRLVALTARMLIKNAPRLSAEPAEGVWVCWLGGECPVDPDDKVFVEFRDGTSSTAIHASELAWHHDDEGTDIVAWCHAR